jgi:hypothetical protein
MQVGEDLVDAFFKPLPPGEELQLEPDDEGGTSRMNSRL